MNQQCLADILRIDIHIDILICHVWICKLYLRTTRIYEKNKFWCLTAYVPPSLIEKNYVNILTSDLLLWPCVFYSRCCVWHDVSLAERPEPVRPVTWGTAFITGSDHFTCSRFMFAGCRKLLISCAKNTEVSDMMHTSAHSHLALTWSKDSS